MYLVFTSTLGFSDTEDPQFHKDQMKFNLHYIDAVNNVHNPFKNIYSVDEVQ